MDFVVILDKNLFICFFYNRLRLFIWVQLNKKNHNLNNKNNIIEKTINAKIKIYCQLLFFTYKSNAYYVCGYCSLKSKKSKETKKLKKFKNFRKAKKRLYFLATNENNRNQSNNSLRRSSKKDSYFLYQKKAQN